MNLSDLEQIRLAAQQSASSHRPRGFSAEAELLPDGRPRVTVRYCWRDNPRFEVMAEVAVVAENAARAVQETGAGRWTTTTVDYLSDSECLFYVEGR